MFDSDLESDPRQTKRTRRSFLLSGIGVLGGVAVASHFGMHRVQADTKMPAPGIVTVVNFGPDGKRLGVVQVPRVIKTDAEWRAQLSRTSFEITRHADTEMAYTGATWNLHDKGIFRCICCDLALFSSDTKFDSGTGWPSFWQPIAQQNVTVRRDDTLGMERTEVRCTQCDAHLGHVFDDGPRPTGLRYCMNSGAMRFVKL